MSKLTFGKSISGTSRPSGVSGPRYSKLHVSLLPEQVEWLRSLPLSRSLSSSDVVRLALARLSDEVTDPVELERLLLDQAHEETRRMPGRKNRGPLR